ncbi:MAG: AmmeMemoRadiSam system radical SAM enzyme [Nitrospinae bacterium]|nr:AmmeMemoRadiSam system radical SAM enzyme [Nitrospinota bacterium]
MHEALYYEKLGDKKVRCILCPHYCIIKPGKVGICMGRENKDGVLYAKTYAQTTSIGVDPIEKKPLYHFYPGTDILSISPNSCNLSCKFCQNWQISQVEVPTQYLSPERAVASAKENNSVGISYTYAEPLMWYEYILDTAALARREGLKNVLVTNGYINKEPLLELLPLIDAMNIDVKSMEDSYYRKICSAKLEPVLKTVEISQKYCHVEVTNLIVTTLNDTDELYHKLTDWLASVNPNIPLHFSRYFPNYKISLPPTPFEAMKRARDIAMKKINYVYIGNVSQVEWNNTYCHNCKNIVISREGYFVIEKNYHGGKCNLCGADLPIID